MTKKGARLVKRIGETPEQFRRRCIEIVQRIDPRQNVTDVVLNNVGDGCGTVVVVWPDADDADDRDTDQLVH